MRKALLAALVAALVVVAGAAAVGPWPGTVSSVTSAVTGVRYSVSDDGTTTELVARRNGQARTRTLTGVWRIPAVTSTELPGGLSPDGRLLVLVQQPNGSTLRAQSKFLVVATRSLRVTRAITLRGEFGFDAVSADRRTLYVIEHGDRNDLNAYIVRAYDLAAGTLLARPVVAKGEGPTMSGYPVARATTTRGTWVYTLYWRPNGSTFVHALGTTQRRAVCLDLQWTTSQPWNSRLALSPDGSKLFVREPSGALVATVATPA